MAESIVRDGGPAPIPPQGGAHPFTTDADAADAYAWAPNPAQQGTTLDPKEYLRFLETLERGLPEGTRAYVIGMEGNGARFMRPVSRDADIVDMRDADGRYCAAGIIRHIAGMNGNQLAELHAFCVQRMREDGIDTCSDDDHRRVELTRTAACEVDDLGGALLSLDPYGESFTTVIKAAGVRLRDLCSLVITLCDREDPKEALRRLGLPQEKQR